MIADAVRVAADQDPSVGDLFLPVNRHRGVAAASSDSRWPACAVGHGAEPHEILDQHLYVVVKRFDLAVTRRDVVGSSQGVARRA